ncbi:hypothetical protein [Streptomyces sp. NPDC001076]
MRNDIETPERYGGEPLYSGFPNEWSEQPRPFTVTIAGVGRHDGESPYTYVVEEHSTETAWARALVWHLSDVQRLDCYVVADESFEGIPAVDSGYAWVDLRPAQRKAEQLVHGEVVTVTEIVARRLRALLAVVRSHARHPGAARLAELLESAASTAAVAPLEDGRRLPAVTVKVLQEAVDLLAEIPELATEIGRSIDRSVAPALGGQDRVQLSSILYRLRMIWPDAEWVLREPPGEKPLLSWRGGPSVEEVGEELRWPDIVMRRGV